MNSVKQVEDTLEHMNALLLLSKVDLKKPQIYDFRLIEHRTVLQDS